MIDRRSLLQRFSAGAGSVVFAPFLRRLEAEERGVSRPPARVIFVLFGNGFHEWASAPEEVSLTSNEVRQIPLGKQKLPFDIEPFTPYKDRLTIVQGLRSGVVRPDHGAGFAALSGMNNGVGDAQHRNVIAESIDAAVARKLPGVFPLLNLGIDPGRPETKTILCSSAWGPGRPIATQCRPELAYESLFGTIGAKKNDFAARKNLLDFISEDIKELESHLTGLEKSQLNYHLDALESLSKRNAQLSVMYDQGLLTKSAPSLPSPFPVTMKENLSAQFDIAASALMTGLTNVVTITSELCRVRGTYSGFSNVGTHALGHNNQDAQQGVAGWEILSRVRRYISEETVGLLKQLESVPEGTGAMLDNTLLVFTSDSANRQHSHGKNWPFLLLGNLGGRLKTNQLVLYPMREFAYSSTGQRAAAAPETNPTINALYNTILHAVGDERDHFNLVGVNKENPSHRGPLKELLI